jgi:hypothetical protein
MFLREPDDTVEFFVIVPIVCLNLNRLQPDLGLLLAFEDVHVRRFAAVGAVEPKFVSFDFDGWHGGFHEGQVTSTSSNGRS